MPDAPARIHQLKITLRDLRVQVWRRLQVPSAITLGTLSDILQDAFEWDGDHLHKFELANVSYVPELLLERSFLGFGPPMIHEDAVRLEQVVPRPGAALQYIYDLGDEWRHRIEVEDIIPAGPGVLYPMCLAGRGLAPEEDSYDYTPGTFTEADRRALNELFRVNGALPGDDLPVEADDVDPVFTALFPAMAYAEEDRLLEPHEDAPVPALAERAATSALVRRAIALAHWVGSGRALTPSKVLRPADAIQAEAELGLAEALLPAMDVPDLPSGRSEFGDWVMRRREQESLRAAGASKRLRSAKDLPALHALWSAAVEAGLIEIRGSKAVVGSAVEIWGSGTAEQRLEVWARLLAGLLGSRVAAEQADRSSFGRGARQEEILPITAHILDDLGEQPFPVLLPALPIATATGDVMGLYGLTDSLLGAVHAAMSDWALAGVVEPTSQPLEPGLIEPLLKELAEGFTKEPAPGPGLSAEQFLRPALTAVRKSSAVRLSRLGSYGVRRLLLAHGWRVAS
ncbi:plasmid pRiA4b ORF-3 family protein [Nonomuraea sp. NPDC059194]|uniref:plasmid pRiA4b ORF-3 family protein n=1 Tax=Nonomuraea sp. NPDC059194 TaxID=3346764 RepID=UPI00367D43E7